MSNYKLPPRQKMINLLYVILIAMLAINISGEVLDGFATANQDMKKNVETLKVYNGGAGKTTCGMWEYGCSAEGCSAEKRVAGYR